MYGKTSWGVTFDIRIDESRQEAERVFRQFQDFVERTLGERDEGGSSKVYVRSRPIRSVRPYWGSPNNARK